MVVINMASVTRHFVHHVLGTLFFYTRHEIVKLHWLWISEAQWIKRWCWKGYAPFHNLSSALAKTWACSLHVPFLLGCSCDQSILHIHTLAHMPLQRWKRLARWSMKGAGNILSPTDLGTPSNITLTLQPQKKYNFWRGFRDCQYGCADRRAIAQSSTKRTWGLSHANLNLLAHQCCKYQAYPNNEWDCFSGHGGSCASGLAQFFLSGREMSSTISQ